MNKVRQVWVDSLQDGVLEIQFLRERGKNSREGLNFERERYKDTINTVV